MAPSSSILLRKRTSDTSRRRSGQLGAVKVLPVDENASPGGAPSATDVHGLTTLAATDGACPLPDGPAAEARAGEKPQCHPATPPAEPAPAEQQAADAAPEDATPTSRFQRLLTDSNAADRWFDDQLTPKGDGAKHCGFNTAAPVPVQSAASQIVDKALKYITSERAGTSGQEPSSGFKFNSATILDKGLDAISGVGKLLESFTMTLDGVIGQAFEEWGTPKSADRLTRSGRPPSRKQDSSAAARAASTGARGVPALKQTHMTSFMNRVTDASEEDVAEWHKRAVGLQAELQKLQSQIEEGQRLRDEYTKMQQDLQQTSTTVSKLEEENELLKQRTDSDAEVDPLAAEQVRMQMEALLAEKAKLAQENARLLRENNGLQELLEFTMMAQSEMVGDDELFGDDQSADLWSQPPLSSATSASHCSTDGYVADGVPSAAVAQLAL